MALDASAPAARAGSQQIETERAATTMSVRWTGLSCFARVRRGSARYGDGMQLAVWATSAREPTTARWRVVSINLLGQIRAYWAIPVSPARCIGPSAPVRMLRAGGVPAALPSYAPTSRPSNTTHVSITAISRTLGSSSAFFIPNRCVAIYGA